MGGRAGRRSRSSRSAATRASRCATRCLPAARDVALVSRCSRRRGRSATTWTRRARSATAPVASGSRWMGRARAVGEHVDWIQADDPHRPRADRVGRHAVVGVGSLMDRGPTGSRVVDPHRHRATHRRARLSAARIAEGWVRRCSSSPTARARRRSARPITAPVEGECLHLAQLHARGDRQGARPRRRAAVGDRLYQARPAPKGGAMIKLAREVTRDHDRVEARRHDDRRAGVAAPSDEPRPAAPRRVARTGGRRA